MYGVRYWGFFLCYVHDLSERIYMRKGNFNSISIIVTVLRFVIKKLNKVCIRKAFFFFKLNIKF